MEKATPVFPTPSLPLLLFLFFSNLFLSSVSVSEEVFYPPKNSTKWMQIPGYHYRPAKNWINDPNGPMYYNGLYHLFYQYSLNSTEWGSIVWAHAVSTDLIRWKNLKPAIFPSKPFDQEGCWSGSATIIPGKGPAILYTGLDPNKTQVQNVAYPRNLSDPYLLEWIKPDYNPIIYPHNLNGSSFRDPTTAWRGPDGVWRVVVGGRRDRLGFAVLYRSKDFRKWERSRHMLHAVADVGMWECPDFFPVAVEGKDGLDTSEVGEKVKHVFKVSLDKTRYEYYTLGEYHPAVDKYVPDTHSTDDHKGLRYDYGNLYASKSFFDAGSRRRILWGWSNESDTRMEDKAKGWSGIQLIPRTIWLDKSGKQLLQWPVEELNKLREKEVKVRRAALHIGSILRVEGFRASEADVEVSFALKDVDRAEPFDPKWTDPQSLCEEKSAKVEGGVGPFGLLVLASGDLKERTAVFFRVFKHKHKHKVLMCHDITRASFLGDVWKPAFGGFVDVDIAEEKKISLRTLIDNSVVESFGGGGKTCITSRVYPTTALGKHAHLFAFNNGTAEVEISHLRAWRMRRPTLP